MVTDQRLDRVWNWFPKTLPSVELTFNTSLESMVYTLFTGGLERNTKKRLVWFNGRLPTLSKSVVTLVLNTVSIEADNIFTRDL